MAADQGFIQAQHNLRLMYYGDQGVAQDYSAAMKWYRMAADQGHVKCGPLLLLLLLLLVVVLILLLLGDGGEGNQAWRQHASRVNDLL